MAWLFQEKVVAIDSSLISTPVDSRIVTAPYSFIRCFAERMSVFTKHLSGGNGASLLLIGACLSRMLHRVYKYW